MKASNILGDKTADPFAENTTEDVPQNLFLFSEESSQISASHHIKFIDDREDPNQVNIARTAAKLSNSKGIKHNFYSRAQENLNKRNKQEKQNKVSVAFADAVKSVKHVKNFADQLEFPFDLTTATLKPMSPRSPPSTKLNNFNFELPPKDAPSSGSAPQTPRSLGGASMDNVEYQSFLRDNKGALRHMMTDIHGGSGLMEEGAVSGAGSFYERNEKLGSAVPMSVSITATNRGGSVVEDTTHSQHNPTTATIVEEPAPVALAPASMTVASPTMAASSRKVSFDFDEFQDYTAAHGPPSTSPSSPSVKTPKTVSFGPSSSGAAAPTASGDIKIEITKREKPQPTVMVLHVVDKAELASVALRSNTPPPPVVIVTPRLNVVGDSSNNGWGGVALSATSTTTIITSAVEEVHSPVSGGVTPLAAKSPTTTSSQWSTNEPSVLSLGSFQAPAVLGGGFRPRSAPTGRSANSSSFSYNTADGYQRQPVPPSSGAATNAASAGSNKPGYLLNTNPSNNLANILLSKSVESTVSTAPIEITATPAGVPSLAHGSSDRHASSHNDLRALQQQQQQKQQPLLPPASTRPSSSGASPRIQSAVTFRNNQASEQLIAKKMTSAATSAGTMTATAMKNDRMLQRAAKEEEISRFIFNPAESANMVTSRAVHEEVLQHQKKILTTPNKNVTITVVGGVNATTASIPAPAPADGSPSGVERRKLQQQQQRPHTADGRMRSSKGFLEKGLTSGTGTTLPKIPAVAALTSPGSKSAESKMMTPTVSPSKIVHFSDETTDADENQNPLSISPEAVASMKTQLNRFLSIVEPEVATDETLIQYNERMEQARAVAAERGLLDNTQANENESQQKQQQVDWKAFATPTKKPSTAPATILKPSSSVSVDMQSPVPPPHYAPTTPLMLLTADLLNQPTVDDPDYFQTTAFSLETSNHSPLSPRMDESNPLLESPLEAPRFHAPEVAPPARSPLQIAKRHKHYSSYVKSILYADLGHLRDTEQQQQLSQPSTPRSPERVSYEEYRQAGMGSHMAEIMGGGSSAANSPTRLSTTGALAVDTSGNAAFVRLNESVKSPRVSDMAQRVNNIHVASSVSASAGKAPRPTTGGGVMMGAANATSLSDQFVAWNAGSFDAAGYYQDYQTTSDLLMRLDLVPESGRPSTQNGTTNTPRSDASSEFNVSSNACSLSPRAAPHSKAIVKAYSDSLNKKMSKEKEIRVARLRKLEEKKREEERQRVLAMNAKVKAALAEAKSRTGHRHGVPESKLNHAAPIAPVAAAAAAGGSNGAAGGVAATTAAGDVVTVVEDRVPTEVNQSEAGVIATNERVSVRFDTPAKAAM